MRRTRFARERVDRRRNGEISLARARGSNADYDIVLRHQLHVLGLAARLGLNDLFGYQAETMRVSLSTPFPFPSRGPSMLIRRTSSAVIGICCLASVDHSLGDGMARD